MIEYLKESHLGGRPPKLFGDVGFACGEIGHVDTRYLARDLFAHAAKRRFLAQLGHDRWIGAHRDDPFRKRAPVLAIASAQMQRLSIGDAATVNKERG
jgi:hypothetical protein